MSPSVTASKKCIAVVGARSEVAEAGETQSLLVPVILPAQRAKLVFLGLWHAEQS
jgi:hypothetical protein